MNSKNRTDSSSKAIPLVYSGQKYRTIMGFSAIKDGIKTKNNVIDIDTIESKPNWLRAKIPSGKNFYEIDEIVGRHSLSTVCKESMCPNIGECWNNGTATIMLMGSVCTRACRFCAVDTGNPNGWLDEDEPYNVAQSVRLMGLEYIVLTSVNRDDLTDGGANHYAITVKEIKKINPAVSIEALTPDFCGILEHVEKVLDSGLNVFAQNIETVASLTKSVRDPRASYNQTLGVLNHAKNYRPDIMTKTSLMLGLGETDREIMDTMCSIRDVGVDILTLGQYLRPTINHLQVKKYLTPDEFAGYRKKGLEMGFVEVVAGPMVRSSYRADLVLKKNNVGLNDSKKDSNKEVISK